MNIPSNSVDKSNYNNLSELLTLFDSIELKYNDIISKHFPIKWRTLGEDLKSFVDNYEKKLNEARKLRIGIVGQIKAGKSTFLNCLLFKGENILPKAVTPMTASLTKLSYEEKQRVEIEFFDENDIKQIEKLAKNSTDKTYEKIINDLNKPEIREKIKEHTASIEFSDMHNLQDTLKDYISESGKYTNIVKYASIYLNYEPIRYIEIIDTPGINDPITSRSTKTKEFVESCDILLLLSRASQFLETSDIDLLSQIYKNKSAKIYAIASKFDSVLDDALSSRKNIGRNFNELFNEELNKRKKDFKSHLEEYKRAGYLQKDIIDTNLFYFSSAFHKKLNNIPLNSDEEIPIKKISERTTNFSLTQELSGFGLISKVINQYQSEKDANAFKSKIIEDYKSERVNSLKNSVGSFQDDALEIINKRAEDIKKEIEKLEEEKNNFFKSKQAISAEIEDVYAKFIEEFTEDLQEFYDKHLEQMENELSIKNLKRRSSKTRSETTYQQIKKKGFLNKIWRFFGLGGYDEIPITKKYKYYQKDVIIDLLEAIVKRFNQNISSQLKLKFSANNVKPSILSIFSKYPDLKDLVSKGIDVSFEAPKDVGISLKVAQDIFYEIEESFDDEVMDDSIFDYVEDAIADLIEIAQKNIGKIKQSIKKQTSNQINSLIKNIENNLNEKIQSLVNQSNLKEDEIKALKNQLKSFINDLEGLKNSPVLN